MQQRKLTVKIKKCKKLISRNPQKITRRRVRKIFLENRTNVLFNKLADRSKGSALNICRIPAGTSVPGEGFRDGREI